MNLKNRIHLWLFRITFIIVGGVLGYAYWYKIGCTSGTCPITSQWHNTMIYGGLMGYLVGEIIKDFFTRKKNADNEQISEHNK